MCLPQNVLLAAKTGMDLAGGVSSLMTSQQLGDQKATYYNYLAGIKDQEAGLIQKQSALQLESFQNQTQSFEASQRSALAANNISLTSGTAQDIMMDTMTQSMRDEYLLRYQSELQLWNKKMESIGYQEKAKQAYQLSDVEGQNALYGSISPLLDRISPYSDSFMNGIPSYKNKKKKSSDTFYDAMLQNYDFVNPVGVAQYG